MSEQNSSEGAAEAPATGDQDSSRDASQDTSQGTSQGTSSNGDGGDSNSDTDENLDEGEPGEVGDAQLPDDLKPTEDNPLARHPDQTGDEDDQIGADREEEPETAPLREEDADYGSGAAG